MMEIKGNKRSIPTNYLCTICNKFYASHSSLCNHNKTFHKIETNNVLNNNSIITQTTSVLTQTTSLNTNIPNKLQYSIIFLINLSRLFRSNSSPPSACNNNNMVVLIIFFLLGYSIDE